MRKSVRSFLWAALFLFGLISCNSNVVHRESKDIPGAEWNKNNILSYTFNIEDTLQPYHVYLNVRNSSEYRFRNLYLFIETTSPHGHTVKDTFECMLADEKGRWYGHGWGDVYENKIPYRQYVRFPSKGSYSIEIQQAMRRDNLKHLTDIGIVLEEAKIQNSDEE
ncbi:MAG: gliding motility lipoprotein GldH [Bacteroidales bacterium]